MTITLEQSLLAFLNLALCAALGWTCLCRLNLMERSTTLPSFRAKYSVLITAAVASALGPLAGIWPNLAQVLLTGAFVFVLAAGTSAWRDGVPGYAQQRHLRGRVWNQQ